MIQFIVSAIALIPPSKMIGDSTESLSLYYGITIGSLLMVTLGNSTETIVGIMSINEGLFDLVKGTIIGGILANILLIPGLSNAISVFRYREQRFDRKGVSLLSTLLLLSVVGLTIPTFISLSYLLHENNENPLNLQLASDVVAFLLLGIYIASVVFTLKLQKPLLSPTGKEDKDSGENSKKQRWSKKRSLLYFCLLSQE